MRVIKLRFQLLQAQEETARLDEEVSILNEKLGNTEAQLRNAQAEIKHQLEENGELTRCLAKWKVGAWDIQGLPLWPASP